VGAAVKVGGIEGEVGVLVGVRLGGMAVDVDAVVAVDVGKAVGLGSFVTVGGVPQPARANPSITVPVTLRKSRRDSV